MGRNHVRIYSEMRDVDEVYIYDVDKSTAKKMSQTFGVKYCSTLKSLLKTVDAVSICVPTTYHFQLAKEALENDVHCLIEKPITSTSEEGEELLKIIPDHLVVGVGHIERFNPIIAEIKKLIKSPKYLEIRRHNPTSARITDAGVVVDLMIHDIDLIWNAFFPETAEGELYSLGDDDFYKMVGKFDDCIISLSASRLACQKTRSIYVEEEDLTIEGDFMAQEVYIYRKPGIYGEVNTRYAQENIIEKVLINRVEPLKEELKTFIQCVQKGEPFPVTPQQAVHNLKIAERN